MSRIAIVGIGCQYPEAESAAALWHNVLAGRRSFREIPAGRLNLDDYHSADRSVPDLTYTRYAGLIEDYTFDRLTFNVPGATYRSSDTAHWLALDVAARALDDAQFERLPVDRRRVAVLVGNTLTGDRTRSSTLRLRWPYVRRAVASVLLRRGIADAGDLLEELEQVYKAPFAPIGEESLAGGLSNTISGRICNYFDFGGGGYTIDGACSSSLLTVIHACIGLQRNDIDFALAGGVDLSIDPFELVGFAKTGALAEHRMRIYDQRSEGFWTGEGCGLLALVRAADAESWGLPVYAHVAGFGVSSDGHGGITRPEVDGHVLALGRAYSGAGYGPDSVQLFEGHGTGTPVGDAAEVSALSAVRRQAGATTPAALGSVKANIGHTKAAAGVAGLIKATMSIHTGVVPATTGCERPLAELAAGDRVLEVRHSSRPWSDGVPRRAGVSSMGFGGINAHITVEQSGVEPGPRRLWGVGSAVAHTAQDAELVPLTADSLDELAAVCRRTAEVAGELTFGRLTDLAINSCRQVRPGRRVRAAVVARSPRELRERCLDIAHRIAGGATGYVGPDHAFSAATGSPRIGLLFTGQGAPVRTDAGALGRRFPAAAEAVRAADLASVRATDTALAQPAIIAGSVAALAALDQVGIEASGAVGHSLGELAALHWGGAFDRAELYALARVRGEAMSACDGEPGGMVELGCDCPTAESLMADLPLSIAALNAADRTVVSGPTVGVEAVVRRAATRGIAATPLRVAHAFHSPLVASAAATLRRWLADSGLDSRTVRRPVVSTVTGGWYGRGSQAVSSTLADQITAPVRFTAAIEALAAVSDLLVEVGPGRILADLAASTGRPTLAVDAAGESIGPFLSVAGAAYALGAPVDLEALTRNRTVLAVDPLRSRTCLGNPCEEVPRPDLPVAAVPAVPAAAGPPAAPARVRDRESADAPTEVPAAPVTPPSGAAPDDQIGTILRELIAARTELPVDVITESSTFLVDLNLNSIAVAQIASDAARAAGREPLASPHEFASGTVGELAGSLRGTAAASGAAGAQDAAGVADWVRPFVVRWLPFRIPGSRRAVAWQLDPSCDHAARTAFGGSRSTADDPPGLVVRLPEVDSEADAHRAIEQVAALATRRDLSRVVVVQAGDAGGLVRTLQTERPDLTVRLLHQATLERVVAQERAAHLRQLCETGEGFEEIDLDSDEQLLVPRLVEVGPAADTVVDEPPVDRDELVLVSGGGKGIGAEAALGLGRDLGARIAVLGRSTPDSDPELRQNLERLRGEGIEVTYHQADVGDAESVVAAVKTIEASRGPVVGILHAAGVNDPALLADLTRKSVSDTWRSKVVGLTNLLAAVAPGQLKLLVAFGSLIGRAGMRGEGHYALANGRMRRIAEEFAADNVSCRVLNLEWSAWSEAGMGEKLGLLEAMGQLGIRPIAPAAGVAVMARLIRTGGEVSPVITGRIGTAAKTLPTRESELPFLRFVERPLVHYPGVELVVEATLAAETDRYLADHSFEGTMLFPAVVGLEAMAQVVHSLTGGRPISAVTDADFAQPITVPRDGVTRVRIAGLVRADGVVDACIRSGETDYEVVHFSASYHCGPSVPPPPAVAGAAAPLTGSAEIVTRLYTDLLFHGPSFQRVTGFQRVESSRCEAEVRTDQELPWFVDYLPPDLVLGDFGARDAFLHAAQVSIPGSRVLPTRCRRIGLTAAPATTKLVTASVERRRTERELVLDVTVSQGGETRETWEGLELAVVAPLRHPDRWQPDLLAARFERQLSHAWGWADDPAGLRLALWPTAGIERAVRSEAALAAVTGGDEQIRREPEGRPTLASGRHVSFSHHAAYTMLLITERAPVGVDLEAVVSRPPETWRGMLDPARFALALRLSAVAGESLDQAATRVWSATECLSKLGVTDLQELVIDGGSEDWVSFLHGPVRVDTILTRLAAIEPDVVIAAARGIATQGGS